MQCAAPERQQIGRWMMTSWRQTRKQQKQARSQDRRPKKSTQVQQLLVQRQTHSLDSKKSGLPKPEIDMTAKANQVDVKIDDVLAKVDRAADDAIAALETGTNELLGGLDEAGNFGKNLGSIGRRLRQRLGSQTNNPPIDDRWSR